MAAYRAQYAFNTMANAYISNQTRQRCIHRVSVFAARVLMVAQAQHFDTDRVGVRILTFFESNWKAAPSPALVEIGIVRPFSSIRQRR